MSKALTHTKCYDEMRVQDDASSSKRWKIIKKRNARGREKVRT